MSWHSPEIAKLVVAVWLPLTVLAVGWWIRQREQINAELIKKRIAIYDQAVPLANDILCFFLGVGHWRELDRLMYRDHPFWSEDCWRRHSTLMGACFEPFAAGASHSALLRLDSAHLRTMIGERFDPAREKVISKTSAPTLRFRETYDAWVGQLARGDRRASGGGARRALVRSSAGIWW